MSSKIGIHSVIGPRDGFGEYLQRIKDSNATAFIKAVDDYGIVREARELLGPRAFTVIRDNISRNGIDAQGMNQWAESGKDPAEAVREYIAAYEPTWAANPADAVECFNEWSEWWAWQSEFYIEMMKQAGDRYKFAIFSTSTGNPPSTAVAFDMIPALQYAKEHGHYLSMHQYGGVGADKNGNSNPLTLKGTEPWHALRHRWLYDQVWKPDADPPLLLTEVAEAGGFDFLGTDVMMDDVRWYENEIAKDDYVVGAFWFTLGKWNQANFQDALPELAEHIVTFRPDTPTDPEEPTEPPVEIDPCKPRTRYQRVCHLIENTKAHPATYAERLAVWMEADKTNGTYSNSVDDALYGPGVDVLCYAYGATKDRQMELTAFRNQYYPDARLEYKPIPNVEPPPESDTLELIWPVAGKRIVTSPFGPRPEMDDFHYGVDMRGNEESRVYIAADGVMEFAGYDTSRPDGGFGFYIRVGHKRGNDTYQTYYAHLEDGPDSRDLLPPVGEKVEQGLHVAYANNTGHSFGSHLHGGLKENGIWVDWLLYLRAGQQPESPAEPEPPTGDAWVGLHLRHHIDETTVQDELNTIQIGRIEAVKISTNANIDNGLKPLLAAGVDPAKMVMRLFMAGDNANLSSPAAFVEDMAIHLRWFNSVNGKYVEIHNEPNLPHEGYGSAWSSPHEFHAWLLDVVVRIRSRWDRLLLGYPGLSPKPEVNNWLLDLKSSDVYNKLDWIGIHAYWSHESQMFDPEHGGYYNRFIDRFHHDLLITEFSHKEAVKADERAKGDQYKMYYLSLPSRIKAAYSYISVDSNYPLEQWRGTDIAVRVRDR